MKGKIDDKAFSSGQNWIQLNKGFDVNNNACIALSWTKETVYNMVFGTIMKYNKVMIDYSKIWVLVEVTNQKLLYGKIVMR